MANPILQNQAPAPGQRLIDNDLNIVLEVVDADADLTAASVSILVNGAAAWLSDAQQSGFAVTKTTITNGFRYTINPTASLPANKQTLIEVSAQDGANNILRSGYTFFVEDPILTQQESQTTAAFEEGFSLKKHGQTQQGVVAQLPLFGEHPQQVSGYEDAQGFPAIQGPLHFGLADEAVRVGNLQPQEVNYFEDQIAYLQAETTAFTYINDKLDDQSREPLDGNEIRALQLYDSAGQNWSASRAQGDGFYGAAVDGQWHYDGVVTAFGDFGTLANGLRKTAWAASLVDPLGLPGDTQITTSIVANGKIRMASNTALTGGAKVARVNSNLRWVIQSDFDIQIDWEAYTQSSGTVGFWAFEVYSDPQHYAYIMRATPGGGSRVESAVVLNGTVTNSTTNATAVTSGKFRFVRSGSTLQRFYDIGGGWVQQGTNQTFGTDDVYVALRLQGDGGANVSMDAHSVTVNSGTVNTKAGWHREAAGTHRGALQTFPTKALIVGTETALNIIDANTDRLWMRFVVSGNNALPVFSAELIESVVFNEGVLLVTTRQDSVTLNEGYTMRIDFNLDEVRIHQVVAETITGAFYRTSHNNHAGRSLDTSRGHLIERNAARNFSGDSNAWGTQSNKLVDASHSFDPTGPYEYRAVASALGISVFRWKRWHYTGVGDANPDNPGETHSNSTANILWSFLEPTTHELFYTDATNMYSLTKTALDAAFGTTFNPSTTKALPGTRTIPSQYKAARVGSQFFLAAHEGIYTVNWPAGSFSLLYGRAGVGAVHSILSSWHTSVVSLRVAKDGVDDILLAGVEEFYTRKAQIVAIKLSNNTIHSKTSVVFGRGGALVGVAA